MFCDKSPIFVQESLSEPGNSESTVIVVATCGGHSAIQQNLSVFSGVLCGHGELAEKTGIQTSSGQYCLLSLWRVVRGSKFMHLDLTHGLFIT
jgi:hypothetical protein